MANTYYKYEVIGRCTNGVNVHGYILLDIQTGTKRMFSRQEVEELALSKTIKNISAQFYGGRVIMKGIGCKLSSLPNYDTNCNILGNDENKQSNAEEIRICARVSSGKSTVGYVIGLFRNNKLIGYKELDRYSTIMLARDGKISNARVQMSVGKPVLRGVNCELTQLKTVKYKETVV